MELNLSTSLLIFLAVHVIAGIWWASSINTTLKNLNSLMTEMRKLIHQHDNDLYSKTQASADFAKRDVKIDAIFDHVDTNRNDITELRTIVSHNKDDISELRTIIKKQ